MRVNTELCTGVMHIFLHGRAKLEMVFTNHAILLSEFLNSKWRTTATAMEMSELAFTICTEGQSI